MSTAQSSEPVSFRATIELGGKTATGIEVPQEVVAALGSSRRPAVHATIAGYTYRTTVGSMRGRFMLPISAAVRAGAGVAAGDEVDVPLALDTADRQGRGDAAGGAQAMNRAGAAR